MEGSLTGPTLAAVLLYPLQTRSSVLTRIRGTFGNIFLAVVTDEARVLAVTPVAVANTNRNVWGSVLFVISGDPLPEYTKTRFSLFHTFDVAPSAPLYLILSSSINDSP